MISRQIEGATRAFGGEDYFPVPVRDEPFVVNERPMPAMRSSWVLQPDEADRLFAGAFVELVVLGTQHPPVLVTVGNEIVAHRKDPAVEMIAVLDAVAKSPVDAPAGNYRDAAARALHNASVARLTQVAGFAYASDTVIWLDTVAESAPACRNKMLKLGDVLRGKGRLRRVKVEIVD